MPLERRSTGFGGRLRDARERRGISLRQIAGATKISVAVLDALERDDISKLPGGIFGRAFIRSYAMEVGLDPEKTIQGFIAAFPNDTAITGRSTPDSVEANEVHQRDRRSTGAVVWLLALAVPLAAGMLYVGVRDRTDTIVSPTPAPVPLTKADNDAPSSGREPAEVVAA